MGKKSDRAVIIFTDGSQQDVWNTQVDDMCVFYDWEHESREMHSFVPFSAVKRIDFLKKE